MNLNWYIPPTRLKRFTRTFAKRRCNLLDVGCRESVRLTKRWLPDCNYFGLDISEDSLTAAEKEMMDGFVLANLETDDLDGLKDGFFDIIIVSHVIEHL